MDVNENTRFYLDNSKDLIEKLGNLSFLKEHIELLRNIIRFHEQRYYVMNDPLISDFEFDTLYTALVRVEQQNPDLITQDSPTQRVGPGITKQFTTVPHLVPMLFLKVADFQVLIGLDCNVVSLLKPKHQNHYQLSLRLYHCIDMLLIRHQD